MNKFSGYKPFMKLSLKEKIVVGICYVVPIIALIFMIFNGSIAQLFPFLFFFILLSIIIVAFIKFDPDWEYDPLFGWVEDDWFVWAEKSQKDPNTPELIEYYEENRIRREKKFGKDIHDKYPCFGLFKRHEKKFKELIEEKRRNPIIN